MKFKQTMLDLLINEAFDSFHFQIEREKDLQS